MKNKERQCIFALHPAAAGAVTLGRWRAHHTTARGWAREWHQVRWGGRRWCAGAGSSGESGDGGGDRGREGKVVANGGVGDGDVGDVDGVMGRVFRGNRDGLYYDAIGGGYRDGGIQEGGSQGEYANVRGCAGCAMVGEVAGVVAIGVKGGGQGGGGEEVANGAEVRAVMEEEVVSVSGGPRDEGGSQGLGREGRGQGAQGGGARHKQGGEEAVVSRGG